MLLLFYLFYRNVSQFQGKLAVMDNHKPVFNECGNYHPVVKEEQPINTYVFTVSVVIFQVQNNNNNKKLNNKTQQKNSADKTFRSKTNRTRIQKDWFMKRCQKRQTISNNYLKALWNYKLLRNSFFEFCTGPTQLNIRI